MSAIRYDVFRGEEVVGSCPSREAALAIRRLLGEGRVVAISNPTVEGQVIELRSVIQGDR